MYSCLKDNAKEEKKALGTIIKRENKYRDHKNGPKVNKTENEIKVLNDDNSKSDEIEEKYSKFLRKNKILRKLQKVINTTCQL